MEGRKNDSGKTRMELLPTPALEAIAEVLTFGAHKYDDWNWAKGMKWSRLIGATLRHLFAWIGGESKDPETGLSHLAHAACCIAFLLTYEHTSLGEDDRHPLQPKPEVDLEAPRKLMEAAQASFDRALFGKDLQLNDGLQTCKCKDCKRGV